MLAQNLCDHNGSWNRRQNIFDEYECTCAKFNAYACQCIAMFCFNTVKAALLSLSCSSSVLSTFHSKASHGILCSEFFRKKKIESDMLVIVCLFLLSVWSARLDNWGRSDCSVIIARSDAWPSVRRTARLFSLLVTPNKTACLHAFSPPPWNASLLFVSTRNPSFFG